VFTVQDKKGDPPITVKLKGSDRNEGVESRSRKQKRKEKITN
jgi:hypothetical protein